MEKLLQAGVPPIIVRLFINMYQKQTADVRWQEKFSKEFTISNGLKQGAVLLPSLFCFYMNNLFKIMRDAKTGCYIGDYFAGLYG